MGCKWIIASGAVGSLREPIAPRDLVLVDQIIDRTYRRVGTFFDELDNAPILIERHTSVAGDIRDGLQHEYQIGIFGPKEFQHWNKVPIDVAITVKNESWVADDWFRQLESSPCA